MGPALDDLLAYGAEEELLLGDFDSQDSALEHLLRNASIQRNANQAPPGDVTAVYVGDRVGIAETDRHSSSGSSTVSTRGPLYKKPAVSRTPSIVVASESTASGSAVTRSDTLGLLNETLGDWVEDTQ